MLLRSVPWGRAMIVLLVLWLLFLFMAVQYLRQEPDTSTNQKITQVLRDLQSLHRQREEIDKLLTEYSSVNAPLKDEKEAILRSIKEKVRPEGALVGLDGNDREDAPSLDYEKTRRRIRMGVEEMWYFISVQVKNLQKRAQNVSPQLTSQLAKILDEGVEHKRSLIRDVNKLSEVDGFNSWRLKEAVALSDLVQRRLSYLQNPADCENSRKLVCKLNKGCGYGCQLHHAVYCLMVAYGTQRTMVLQSKGWRYNRSGWESVFRPVSETCTDVPRTVVTWPGKENTPAVLLGIIDSVSPRPSFLPLAVPKDLADRIAKLHGDPAVWWVGQILKYLMRPQPQTTDMLRDAAVKFKYQRPIVGVHIRRTDKVGTEAAFHSVDEYMLQVEEYFKQIALTQTVTKKRIYLASDDAKVFKEVATKYPEYEIVGDPEIAKSAAVSTRYSDGSLNGIIMDIYFLAQSDFLVCTFSSQAWLNMTKLLWWMERAGELSLNGGAEATWLLTGLVHHINVWDDQISQVCRVAYEIMQSLHPDYAARFRSLDDIYYYGGQGMHKRVAVMSHRASSPDQMDLEVGDVVGVAGNHWDGYSKGRNLRTKLIALYPSFKVDDVVETVDFPPYAEVPLYDPGET